MCAASRKKRNNALYTRDIISTTSNYGPFCSHFPAAGDSFRCRFRQCRDRFRSYAAPALSPTCRLHSQPGGLHEYIDEPDEVPLFAHARYTISLKRQYHVASAQSSSLTALCRGRRAFALASLFVSLENDTLPGMQSHQTANSVCSAERTAKLWSLLIAATAFLRFHS